MPAEKATCRCGYVRTTTATSRPLMDAELEASPPDPTSGRGGSFGQVTFGAVLLALGIFVTVATYRDAIARGGGTYTIAYGAIIAGAVKVSRGLFSHG